MGSTNATLYLTCVLCRKEGVIRYPGGYECPGIDIVGDFTGRLVAAIVCYGCCHIQRNERAIEYFADCGVPLRYLALTFVNDAANLNHKDNAVMISKDGFRADILDIRFLTRTLVKTCTLHSFEYSEGRLFKVPPKYDFFGLVETHGVKK